MHPGLHFSFYVHPWIMCLWFCFGVQFLFDIFLPFPRPFQSFWQFLSPGLLGEVSPETLQLHFHFVVVLPGDACVPGMRELWVLTGNSCLQSPFCPLWKVCLVVLRWLLRLLQSTLCCLWFSSSSRNFKEICIIHLPRRPKKYFNSSYVLQHLQAAFFIVADWHLPALPAVSLLHLCLGPCPVPPHLLSHLTWSTLCWHDGSLSGCLAPFSIDSPLFLLFWHSFHGFFLIFMCWL